jgi:hypothetical protein
MAQERIGNAHAIVPQRDQEYTPRSNWEEGHVILRDEQRHLLLLRAFRRRRLTIEYQANLP